MIDSHVSSLFLIFFNIFFVVFFNNKIVNHSGLGPHCIFTTIKHRSDKNAIGKL